MAVHQDHDVLHRDHPLGDQRLQVGEEELDLVLRIDDFDEDWQVGGHLEEAGLVDNAVGAEAFGAAEDGGAGEAELARFLDDRLVERLAGEAVGFTDEDAQQDAVLIDRHVGPRLKGRHRRERRELLGEVEGVGLVVGALAVHHDVGALEGGHAADEVLIEVVGDEGGDAVGGIDDLDDDGDVLCEGPGGALDEAAAAEAEDAVENRGPGETAGAGGFDDALPGGGGWRAVGALEVDAEEDLFAVEAHGHRRRSAQRPASQTPALTAINPSTRLPIRLSVALMPEPL